MTVAGIAVGVAEAALGCGADAADAALAMVVIRRGRHAEVLGGDGYRLVVRGGGAAWRAEIEGDSDAGVRAGLATLRQLMALHGDSLPGVEIIDWPALATRGVMLDVSRCRIPTMEEFGRVVPLLASMKFNHLQLYTEHTFAYREHREVWEGWDPLTGEEVRELAGLCARHGIALGANQNCFGHMKHWLERPRYAGLAETHGEFDFYGMRRRGPFSVCPVDPASREFVCRLLDELCPNFDARGSALGAPDTTMVPAGGCGGHTITVNIGCDETADVGAGRSREAVAARGKAGVYGEYVASVMRHVVGRGWRPQFWADIAMEHPGALDALPPEATALAWGYEGDSPFERWGRTLAEAGREWWVCPGTSSWRSITGRTAERRANIEAAARAGVAHGASGFMVCDWGDVGHMQQWPVALAALAQAADAAWTGGREGYDARAATVQAFGEAADGAPDGDGGIGPWLDGLGDVDEPLRRRAAAPDAGSGMPALRNASALFSVLWPAREEFGRAGAIGSAREWEGVIGRLGGLAAGVPRVRDGLVSREIAHTIDWAMCAARVGHAMAGGGAAGAGALAKLGVEMDALETAHAALWRLRSREGGLTQSREFRGQARERLAGLAVARG